MTKKFYELSRWDKANHDGEIHTFTHIDGAYAHWTDDKWEVRIWHFYEYELRDWIYFPLQK